MRRHRAVLSLTAAVALLAAGCSSGGSDAASPASTPSSSTSTPSTPSTSPGASMAAGPMGPGCAAYAAQVPSGAGSVAGMAGDPVATAAGHNPLLTTLVAAVSGKLNPKVDLVNTLNGGEFTVFAPVDTAFTKVDAATVDKLKTDGALLTKVLTYHVVAGRIAPDAIVGTHRTVEGSDVTVTGTPAAMKVNGANVICGGVQTANATVYLIDGVLTPAG